MNLNLNNESNWKSARSGVIIFCMIHFMYEIFTGNTKSFVLPVLFNFWVSSWYIKNYILKSREIKTPLLIGLSVSGVVFLLRLVLGTLFLLMMTK